MEDDIVYTFFDIIFPINFIKGYLPDDLDKTSTLDFYGYPNFVNYCPDKNCNTDLEKIAIGFLWLLEQYFTKYSHKGNIEKSIKPFFIYIISWLSYKLNQKKTHGFTKINDFYTNHINDSNKYKKFKEHSSKFTGFNEFIDRQQDLFNINIEDLSKFYDAFKLICNMYSNVETNNHDKLPNNANDFIDKYTELNNNCNIKGTARSKIFSALSTNYDNFKKYCNVKGANCKDFPLVPETALDISALRSGDISSSSIGKKLFTVLSIFGAIAFFLGISYKVNNKEFKNYFHYIYPNVNKENYSLFGFRKRAQKQYIREKIKNIKKRMNH
ncbi:hypothetical protein YYC_05507 [Plasmodium yoelii 17X]|uniref:Uncharacterized protein n=1 Tax=Plasmodium yoelii 17X TaxID=1323249 RepID=V7PEC2_PLAYE|nr:hypothetical protein YYC_05507 [Plasmodium yoelii 17X]